NFADPKVDRTPLVRNTFGGAFGGPIVKNKAFFFYSYEGRHDANGQSVSRLVPLANVGQGVLNYQWCPATDSLNPDKCTGATQNATIDATNLAAAFSVAGINQNALTALADA